MADKPLFKDFAKWFSVYDAAQSAETALEKGKDNFNPERHRQAAASVIQTTAEEQDNLEDMQDIIGYMAEHGSVDDVLANVKEGHTKYGRRVDDAVKNRYDDLLASLDDKAKTYLYEVLPRAKPKEGIEGLTDKEQKALKAHQFLANIGSLVDEYREQSTTHARRAKIEEELVNKRNKNLEETYCKDEKSKSENAGLVKNWKKWNSDSPKRVIEHYLKKQEAKMKEFQENIKPEEMKGYARKVLDEDYQRRWLGTGLILYQLSERQGRRDPYSELLI